MLHFRNDYSAGAHPEVLEALCRTNLELTAGYGADAYCQDAADRVRSLCGRPEAAVHFLVGGTQANKTAIAAFLRPWEAVIAAETGHICVHETGAVEQDGHKIIHLPTPDGKLTPELLRAAAASHTGEHMVAPRLAYISNTTELGTVYCLEELRALRTACDELGLYLYCDGARLGSAMDAGDTAFAHYARFCDAFTIGGTKNGLLFGEALVIVQPGLQPGFRHCMKQQGAILAKGRLLRLTAGLEALGVPLLADSPSNQVFPILPDSAAAALEAQCAFEIQERLEGGRTCIRFVTAWNTQEADVDALLAVLGKLLGGQCS